MRRRQQRQQNSSSFSRSSNDNAAAPRGWDEVHLRSDDTAPDGSCDLLGALGAQPDVTVLVADEDVADEAVGLAG
eukprot:CAMPEP_0115745694 /NCGR_PEP_ID=MMETSP0272-20121206/92251_1 /TAXON_ID=71861 /ORGANISM="Scrippsiella trochoidea, Strain CCMP3099" /LENGTH=74 /DNA_ID=CAMNT_0003190607 /DNA_START=220 /DNA_END=442 /DNA_ORIENTATION=+